MEFLSLGLFLSLIVFVIMGGAIFNPIFTIIGIFVLMLWVLIDSISNGC